MFDPERAHYEAKNTRISQNWSVKKLRRLHQPTQQQRMKKRGSGLWKQRENGQNTKPEWRLYENAQD
jgi:hypothetical protein